MLPMKTILCISVIIMSLLSACQTRVITEHGIEREAVAQKPGNSGTVDGAGCNGIEGVCLDKYIKHVTDITGFNDFVSPILEKLKLKVPDLASDLNHIVMARDWYIIPSHLPQLPTEIIGTVIETDQYALQNTQLVMIDDINFAKLEPRDKMFLVVHE